MRPSLCLPLLWVQLHDIGMSDSESNTNPRIEQLQVHVQTLQKQVDTLRAELRGARQRIDLTMRGQLRCPACGCTKIAHALSILDRGESDSRATMSLYRPKWWSGKAVGELEAYACTKCGLLEWYVQTPEKLVEHEKYLRILESDQKPQGPYR